MGVPTVLSVASLQQQTAEQSVVGFEAVAVFKVFFKDRIQQRPMSDRSLTFQFSVVPHMILLLLARQLHPQHRVMRLGKGVFGLFPEVKKKSEVRLESESEGAQALELMDSGGLWLGYFD